MKAHPTIILWVLGYLTNRLQFVQLKPKSHTAESRPATVSTALVTNTGAPQGTVLSSSLLTPYTADCRASQDDCTINKYADNTVLIGMITGDDDSHYRQEVDRFFDWGDRNCLKLNVSDTKKMVIDFRKNKAAPIPIEINWAALNGL